MEHANVDTSQTTHVSLCSGYGGIDLGLRRVCQSLRTVAYAEIEAFAIECLLARMEGGQLDAAPIWSDLKSFPWAEFSGKVDILTGGYPCQPFSAAGKRAGKDDPRHLWPWIADGIAIMRPRVCFFENVEGHISLGLSSVISDLEELGYTVSWGIFSASECGAPQQRKRVFILAHSKSAGLERYNGLLFGCGEPGRDTSKQAGQAGWSNSSRDTWPSRPKQPQHAWEPPRVVGNANSDRRECNVSRDASQQDSNRQNNGVSSETVSVEWNDRQAESALGRDADGTSSGLDYAELCVTCDNRTDELRLLGNGVVPATAALAFTTLLNEQRNPRHLA